MEAFVEFIIILGQEYRQNEDCHVVFVAVLCQFLCFEVGNSKVVTVICEAPVIQEDLWVRKYQTS